MAPFPTAELSGEDSIQPRLIVAITGSAIGFIALIVSFCLIAHRFSCARPRRAHTRTRTRPSRGGVISPTASLSSSHCVYCLRERPANRDTLESPHVPPPHTYPRSPISPSPSHSHSPSLMSASSDAVPLYGRTVPASPPLAYVYGAARGPIGPIARGRRLR